MNRWLGLFTVLTLTPVPGSAQPPPSRLDTRPGVERRAEPGARFDTTALARRAQLEARLYERFVDRVARDLDLEDAQRERLARVIRETARDRAALARESREIRNTLVHILRDSTVAEGEIIRLLDRLDRVREDELAIWRRERERLGAFLTPRQQAAFLGLRARFNEQLLNFRSGRRSGGMQGGVPPATPP